MVKVLCRSIPSGFHIEQFINLSIEKMVLSNCSGYGNATVHLATGSEVSLEHVTITNTSGDNATGPQALDVVGSFSVVGFVALKGGEICVNYSLCDRASYFNFSNNSLSSGLLLGVKCSDVHLLIADSVFLNGKVIGLNMDFDVLTDNTVMITDTVFRGALCIYTCYSDCDELNLHCTRSFLALDRVTFHSFAIFEIGYLVPTKNCTIFINNSLFSGMSYQNRLYGVEPQIPANTLATIQNAVFANNNVEKDNSVVSIVLGTILFANCSFKNNTGSAIHADASSKLIFEGVNIFRNNSAQECSCWSPPFTCCLTQALLLRTTMQTTWQEQFIVTAGISIHVSFKLSHQAILSVSLLSTTLRMLLSHAFMAQWIVAALT